MTRHARAVCGKDVVVAKMKKEVKKMFLHLFSCVKLLSLLVDGKLAVASWSNLLASNSFLLLMAAHFSHHIFEGKENKVKTNQKQIDACEIGTVPEQTQSIVAFKSAELFLLGTAMQRVNFARRI